MAPSACVISAEALAECFLRHYKTVNQTTFSGATCESVHCMNKKFLADVWNHTNRLTKPMICSALKLAWPALAAYQVKQISTLLPETFQALGKKGRNHKTGERMARFYEEIFSPDRSISRRVTSKTSPEKAPSIESLYGLSSPDRKPEISTPAHTPVPSIEALYGLPVPSPGNSADLEMLDDSPRAVSVVDIATSQEKVPEKGMEQADLPHWWNANAGKMELQDPLTNKPIFAKTELGPQGFLVAEWPDGSISQTEISNLAKTHAATPVAACNEKGRKRPAAHGENIRKRPAAEGVARKPAAADEVAAPRTPPSRPPRHDSSPLGGIGIFSPRQNKLETPSFGMVRKHIGIKNGYIQHWNGSKWICLLHVTDRMCGGTLHSVINQLMAECALQGQTKNGLQERKVALCAAGKAAEDVN